MNAVDRPGLLGWVGCLHRNSDERIGRCRISPRRSVCGSASVAAPRLLVLRSRGARSRAAAAVRARARLRRPRADGARTPATTTRSPRATTRRRSCATRTASSSLSNICRHRQAIMLQRAAATRATSSARSTAGPTTSRASCSARRISPTSPASTSAARRCRTGTACCSTARATSRATSPRSACERFRLLRLHARPRRDARVQLQLEVVHRGLSRGLPRRAVPSGPRPVRHLRRPEAGSSATGTSVQTVGINNSLAKPGTQDLRALAQGGARLLPRRDPAARRDLAHLLPEHHARVVSARARHQHADPARRRPDAPTSSSSTIPRRSRCSSASSSRPSRPRTWRPRARTTRSPSGWTPAAARCTGRDAARTGPTSRRWKTACSTSTSSSAAKWTRTSRTCNCAARSTPLTRMRTCTPR